MEFKKKNIGSKLNHYTLLTKPLDYFWLCYFKARGNESALEDKIKAFDPQI